MKNIGITTRMRLFQTTKSINQYEFGSTADFRRTWYGVFLSCQDKSNGYDILLQVDAMIDHSQTIWFFGGNVRLSRYFSAIALHSLLKRYPIMFARDSEIRMPSFLRSSSLWW